jgi:hypothetical protein
MMNKGELEDTPIIALTAHSEQYDFGQPHGMTDFSNQYIII